METLSYKVLYTKHKVAQYLTAESCKLKMYTMNCKAMSKTIQQIIASKPTKDIKQNSIHLRKKYHTVGQYITLPTH